MSAQHLIELQICELEVSLEAKQMEREYYAVQLEAAKLDLERARIELEHTSVPDNDHRRPSRHQHTEVRYDCLQGQYICHPWGVEEDELMGYPHGVGPSPEAACEAFDKVWREG